MTDYHDRPRKLHRTKRRFSFGFGVCHGIAEYLQLPVWVVQAIAIVICLSMKIVPFLVLYFIAALLMPVKPDYGCQAPPEPFPRREDSSPKAASWKEVKDVMARLDRRIQRMESVVTSRDYDWDRRLNS